MGKNIIKAMQETIERAKQTGLLCYLCEDYDQYKVVEEYQEGWLFKAYPGGRKELSRRGAKLVEPYR